MRNALLIMAAAWLAAGSAGVAQQPVQQPARIDPSAAERIQQLDPEQLRRAQALNPNRLQPSQQLQVRPDQGAGFDPSTGAGYRLNPENGLWYGWVNFDQSRALGRLEGEDVTRAWREQAGGVRFATGQREGARIIRCGQDSNTCALPRPESPDALIAGAGSGSIRIDFAQPVAAVTVLTAPDRGFGTEPDLFVMEGWRDGDIAAITRAPVEIYDSNAQGWTRLTLSSLSGGLTTRDDTRAATASVAAGQGGDFDYVIVRGVSADGADSTTPIVMDALRFIDRHGPTPYDSLGPRAGGMEAMVRESGVSTQRLQARSQVEVMTSGGARVGMRYPEAERMRMPVDTNTARLAALRQREMMSMDLPEAAGFTTREPLTLPILAPLGVFAGEDPAAGLAEGVRFSGRSDYFHLRFNSDIGRVVISGSRMVVRGAQDAGPALGEMTVSSGYDGAYASFNLYGAAYSVRVACGTEEIDEPCNDPEALRTLLDRLFVWMPERS